MSFASGLPFNLSGGGFAFQAWLASENVNLKSIGFYSLVGLPYIFKFLWAPLLDRYLPPLLRIISIDSRTAVPAVMTSSTIRTRSISGLPTIRPPSP